MFVWFFSSGRNKQKIKVVSALVGHVGKDLKGAVVAEQQTDDVQSLT